MLHVADLRPRQLAGEQPVEHHTQREQVAARVTAFAAQALRRHVGRRAADFRRPPQRIAGRGAAFGDAEIADLGVAPAVGQHDVLGLDVVVQHAAGVRVIQRGSELSDQVDDRRQRRKPLAADLAGKRLARQALHRDVRAAIVGLADVEDGDDVRVGEVACGARLYEEPAAVGGVGGDLLVQAFDRHLALDVRIEAGIDHCHRAFAEDALDAVAADLRRRGTRAHGDRSHHQAAAPAAASSTTAAPTRRQGARFGWSCSRVRNTNSAWPSRMWSP